VESISVRIKLFLIGLLIFASLPSAAQARFEAGLLTCEVEAGVALIMSSPRDLHCVFHKSDGLNEAYGGTLQSVGAEIGVSGRGVIAWTVIAETRELPPGVLAGEFGGVEAGGAAVVGGRGQVLVGGSRRTITLQPVSVEAEIGLNLAIGVTSMELRPLFRGRHGERAARVPAVGFSHEAVPDHRQMPHYGCGSYVHLRRGQTLYGIAHECGVTVEALLDANPQITNVRRIADGALIHLPRHVGHHGRSPCGDRGILQENESLDHLAWRCGVTLHALLSANPEVRDLGRIEDGLVLRIPDREAPRRREAPVRWAKTESDVPLGWQTVSQRSERVDVLVPGTDFNATGIMSCARSRGQPMTQCRFGVKRKGNGNGSITVFWPDGGNRVIYFEAGTPAYYDQSEADGGARMTVSNEDDLFTVRIGTQRFEFPEVVITGD
jgi:hypothetical protein